MVGEHPGRGDNSRLRREKADGGTVWLEKTGRKAGRRREERRKKEQKREGEREEGKGGNLIYTRVSNPQAPTIVHSAFFTQP